MSETARIFKILTRAGVADPGQDATLAELAALVGNPDSRILLHFHGGLVDERAGKETADLLSSSGGWNLPPAWTQIYVIWRSGAFETIRDAWLELNQQHRLYRALLERLAQFFLRMAGPFQPAGAVMLPAADDPEIHARLFGELEPRAPFAAIDAAFAASVALMSADAGPSGEQMLTRMFMAELAEDREFALAAREIAAAVQNASPETVSDTPHSAAAQAEGSIQFLRLSEAIRTELLDARLQEAAGAAGTSVATDVFTLLQSRGGSIFRRCLRRFRTRRDHGLHATIVEELARELYADTIGAQVWTRMLEHAAGHFTRGDGFGNWLLDALPATGTPQPRIAVTAHSAGSVLASHMLGTMQKQGRTAQINLYLLAPAVRHDFFRETLAVAGHHIASCRQYKMRDELEIRDAVLGHDFGYIYPASLLYLVSALFERRDNSDYVDAPLLGMDRFSRANWLDPEEARDALEIGAWFQSPENRIFRAREPGATDADCHGCFSRDPTTLAHLGAAIQRL